VIEPPKVELILARETFTMRQQIEVGEQAKVKKGEEFDWINSGSTACHIEITITDNDPPLDSNRYDVAPGVPEPARARSTATVRGDHAYQCTPAIRGKRTNPHIIIS
jgi:hypothetical protein